MSLIKYDLFSGVKLSIRSFCFTYEVSLSGWYVDLI